MAEEPISADEIKARVADLKAKAAKRRGKVGFSANVIEIEQQIETLEDYRSGLETP